MVTAIGVLVPWLGQQLRTGEASAPRPPHPTLLCQLIWPLLWNLVLEKPTVGEALTCAAVEWPPARPWWSEGGLLPSVRLWSYIFDLLPLVKSGQQN